MAGETALIEQAVEKLVEVLGQVDLASQVYAFDFTDYYHKEMGGGLRKQFFSFEHLRPPEYLIWLKRRTAACERTNRTPGGSRRVNIDPGYWSDAKLVLASTKNYAHRIALGRRVFGEVTMRCHKGQLEPLEWTYPDYRTPLALEFFEKVRRKYLEQIAQI